MEKEENISEEEVEKVCEASPTLTPAPTKLQLAKIPALSFFVTCINDILMDVHTNSEEGSHRHKTEPQ